MAIDEKELMAGLTKAEKKQLRAKARRKAKSKKIRRMEREISELYKPIEQWDDEELARGRPRNSLGTFAGPAPTWVKRDVHEEAVGRFKEVAGSDMRALVPTAITTVRNILEMNGQDDKGRPLVPPSVKLDAAKWVVEHLIGKPTQRTEMDISIKLQAILAGAMVTEGDDAIDPAHREIMELESEEMPREA